MDIGEINEMIYSFESDEVVTILEFFKVFSAVKHSLVKWIAIKNVLSNERFRSRQFCGLCFQGKSVVYHELGCKVNKCPYYLLDKSCYDEQSAFQRFFRHLDRTIESALSIVRTLETIERYEDQEQTDTDKTKILKLPRYGG